MQKNTANKTQVFALLKIFTDATTATASPTKFDQGAKFIMDAQQERREFTGTYSNDGLTYKGVRNLVEKCNPMIDMLVDNEEARAQWELLKAWAIERFTGAGGTPTGNGVDVYKVSQDKRNGRKTIMIPVGDTGLKSNKAVRVFEKLVDTGNGKMVSMLCIVPDHVEAISVGDVVAHVAQAQTR